ncbi:hypothetical protein [Clostridium sp.]|uniref:hypothetical protein n=1 Tax=Clostridium sp. TaxID=1506 RepID=UPI0026036B39|nr:hypothetical protein [Clostridium sp.]
MSNIKLIEINRNNSQPKNETVIHNTLKEIGKYILFKEGCRIIATEVYGFGGWDDEVRKSIMTCGVTPLTKEQFKEMDINNEKYIEYNKKHFKIPKSRVITSRPKNITDVAGIKIKTQGYREDEKYKQKTIYETISIEAKATLSDFKNGYCYGANKNYVIAPKDIIPKEYLHKNIGLIEVDLDSFKIINNKNGIDIEGIGFTKNCKKIKNGNCKTEEEYQLRAETLLEYISKRCTNELLFWNNKVPLYKKVR